MRGEELRGLSRASSLDLDLRRFHTFQTPNCGVEVTRTYRRCDLMGKILEAGMKEASNEK